MQRQYTQWGISDTYSVDKRHNQLTSGVFRTETLGRAPNDKIEDRGPRGGLGWFLQILRGSSLLALFRFVRAETSKRTPHLFSHTASLLSLFLLRLVL